MKSMEDKSCFNNNGSTTPEISFEFHSSRSNGLNRSNSHHRTPLGKPTPSKWDDAQKWLVNLSRSGEKKIPAKASPRNSNADDRRLINKDCDNVDDVVTKNVDCDDESIWRINKQSVDESCNSAVRSICLRDMGTEMTPIASQEPSRTATPVRASTPVARSPVASSVSTPIRSPNQNAVIITEKRSESVITNGDFLTENGNNDHLNKMNPLETRAAAWDEAERAKYMARYKQEEVKIQAWENHEKRKAEMEMRKTEVKAERIKCRAQEKYTNKVAAARRVAEEKRANAEAKLNEKEVKTSARADYIRRTGHLPSSFSFKLPSFCSW